MSTLRRGDKGSKVTSLQIRLAALGFNIAIDGDYGPQTRGAVVKLQEFRCVAPTDGIFGPMTAAETERCEAREWKAGQPWKHETGVMVYGWRHPIVGRIPSFGGKISSFGGPDDKGDRLYGQALISASNVSDLYRRYPELVGPVFRPGLSDPLPQIDGIVYRGPKISRETKQAGISWCLDPNGLYCAARWSYAHWPRYRGRPDSRAVRLLVGQGDRFGVGVPTDWGPAKRTKRDYDLSPGWMKKIGARTDSTVWALWAANDYPIG